jgi:hypothetical protein
MRRMPVMMSHIANACATAHGFNRLDPARAHVLGVLPLKRDHFFAQPGPSLASCFSVMCPSPAFNAAAFSVLSWM